MTWSCWWTRAPGAPPAPVSHITHRPRIGWHYRPRPRRHLAAWKLVCVAVPGVGIAAAVPPLWGALAGLPGGVAPDVPLSVPEPSSLAVLAAGVCLVGWIRRKR